MLLGAEPPEDRSCLPLALDLIHAARTGQFSDAGGPSDQPGKIEAIYRHVLMLTMQVERMRDRLA